MNFGFSGEMLFLFFLALILFGPKKLPEIARQIGRFMNEFRRASYEFRSQIESEVYAAESQSKPQILPPQRAKNGLAGDPALPAIRAAQGSLASRIFNPPSPEQMQAAENQAAEAKAAETPAATTQAAETRAAKGQAVEVLASPAAAENFPAVETGPAPSPAPKVAPDA